VTDGHQSFRRFRMAPRPVSRLAIEVLVSSAVTVAEVKCGARRGFLTLHTIREAASEIKASGAGRELMLRVDES